MELVPVKHGALELSKAENTIHHYLKGHKAPTIHKLLAREGIKCSRRGIHGFLRTFEETGLILRVPGSGRPSKITREVKEFVERQMELDNETTAYQLHELLVRAGYNISLSTILRCRLSLGWMFRGSAYCQLIREANKAKRLQFAQDHLNDTFQDVLWTDECTIQMESHRRFACRKKGQAPSQNQGAPFCN